MLLMCSRTVFYILLHLNPLKFKSHVWLVATKVDLTHLNIQQLSLRSKSLHPLPQHLHQSQYFGTKKSLLPDYIQVHEAKLKTRNLSCFCSVAQLCPTLWPHGGSMTGLPVLRQLLELGQTHVHWVSDAIQPSHPLSSPSPPALNLSQHQHLF